MSNIEAPTDLITIRQAEDLTGYSRTWIRNHVQVFTVAGVDKVSQKQVLQAKEEYETPRPKGGN